MVLVLTYQIMVLLIIDSDWIPAVVQIIVGDKGNKALSELTDEPAVGF